jgi:hypothetical protein
MTNRAIIQIGGSTHLVPELTEENFKDSVYRCPSPACHIVVENGSYVEINETDGSRQVLFRVR